MPQLTIHTHNANSNTNSNSQLQSTSGVGVRGGVAGYAEGVFSGRMGKGLGLKEGGGSVILSPWFQPTQMTPKYVLSKSTQLVDATTLV